MYNYLKRIRLQSKLTQQELANKLGILSQVINEIEKGTFDPGLILTIQLAEVLRVDIKEIFPYKYK